MESVPLVRKRVAVMAVLAAAAAGSVLCTAAPAEARPVTVPGLGVFEVPDHIPLPAGIPGIATPEPAPRFAPAPGDLAIQAARSKLGAPYVSGGTGPNTFDCSGLVKWAYQQAGVDVPRTSWSQLSAGTPVPLDQLRVGDVISYSGGGHSALYAGDGQVIHAATTTVEISPMSYSPVVGARRY
ncbi:C40 family peptidase [Nocardia sp. NPDC058499]|uniref:C40 family peptidase n=1 Tax=Nocardia sp. NPDC058499 TaxID=3346530 RepID=UPI00365074ED